MKLEINKFTPYANCPSGEYWATFCNSEVKKYPRGKREIISFLILNEDKKTPRLNNKGEPYYSTIICNQSKGSNPKSKVSKIKKAMLTKEEYDPIDVCLGVPNFDNFNKRKMKITVPIKPNLKKKSKKSIDAFLNPHSPRSSQKIFCPARLAPMSKVLISKKDVRICSFRDAYRLKLIDAILFSILV